MAIANAASLGLGALQTTYGLASLINLNKQPNPEYSISPELQKSYDRAEGMSNRGYSAEETAAFKGNMAGLNAQRYQKATDMAGGGLSQAIQGGINYGNIKSILGFAADDANLHRKNIMYADNLAHAIQSQKNLIQQEKIRRRNALEQGFGTAMKVGTENIANSLNLTQALDFYKGLNSESGTFGEKYGMTETKPIQPKSTPQFGIPQNDTPLAGLSYSALDDLYLSPRIPQEVY